MSFYFYKPCKDCILKGKDKADCKLQKAFSDCYLERSFLALFNFGEDWAMVFQSPTF